ncbi:TolC family protein [Oxalobacteraceae bacterium CAVE-383]|nr:TolC family protein [Oxalobacteraceae bacterium CAVE-383]
MKKQLMVAAAALLLNACSSYQALPLDERTATLPEIPHLTIDSSTLSLPELPAHAFAPSDQGLDMTDVAILAVVNNPDLRAARNDANIAHAQAFSASLLPDPQLALAADFNRNPDANSSRGYSIGPSYDFGSLLTHSTLRAAADAESSKADLTLLWQEWQVVAQARLLFIKLTQGDKLAALLRTHRAFYLDRNLRNQEALRRRLITADTAAAAEAALQDIDKQRNDLERQTNQSRHDLNALLGLAPGLQVPLAGDASLPPLDRARIQDSLAHIAQRRPDLIALQYGYKAQDQRYRAAIIAQFPALSFGLTRTRDTSNVSSQGFNLSLSVPIFNRNRGNIAIEKATRQKLYDDYRQRLDAARSDIDRILAEQEINGRQMVQVDAGVRKLEAQAKNVQIAARSRSVDELLLATIDAALMAKQNEQIALAQSMFEQRVVLQSLLGGELPVQYQGKDK